MFDNCFFITDKGLDPAFGDDEDNVDGNNDVTITMFSLKKMRVVWQSVS